ncbi:MAG: hypothetical protein V4529_03715 [Gemmatimonadota bacterium]
MRKFITVPNSSQGINPRMRDAKVTLPCTSEQKRELTRRATEAGLSVANFLRSLLQWPLEEHGARKDLDRSIDP